jgi:hypothetical protein
LKTDKNPEDFFNNLESHCSQGTGTGDIHLTT